MAVYVVTWNLNKERAGYDQARREFIAQVEQYDHTKDSGLETVRWISTHNTPAQIRESLRKKMDNNDRLFISKVSEGGCDGWVDQATWDWINARV